MAIPDIDPSDAKLVAQAKAAAAARAAQEASSVNAASDALRKLTSGGTLNNTERALLNMSPVPAPYNPLSGNTPDYQEPYVSGSMAAGNAYAAAGDAQAAAAAAEAARVKAEADAAKAKTAEELAAANAARVRAEQDAAAARAALTASNNAATIAAQQKASADALAKQQARQSAIDVVTARFAAYGLGSLASKIKELAVDGATEATITLGLQATDEYKMRFKANDARIKAGLQVLQPAEYLNLEDGYRQVLRSYGLTQFSTDDYVQQFIANDVSAKELSDRVSIATQRVQNADPAVLSQLQSYYGIGPKDAVAYMLDPNQQITKIQRQVAAAEVGVAAAKQGLRSDVAVSEQLAAQGIDQAMAQKGYATIADYLPTAEKLSQIYGQVGQYDQSTAEQDVFNQLASAQRTRKKLSETEIAAFSGSSGAAKGAFSTGYLNKPTNAGQF